ncbi:hypothetical protein [Peribacillus asahii]|uniref:hypothetical protein n=1 Tax=Peribacillus asahii TaxID=228899 RepID=UPI0020795633|nr:hypothetical protein [Peribacillus asahii]USK72678.1 hypothetical protein LIS76_23435 [Peribacillus asahii]USK72715.1 hypothetical protein LIS76_24015 [Peribacillus asahii]
MANRDIQASMTISREAYDWFLVHAPQKLTEARENAIKAMGMVWADEAKEITREDNHIDTSLYINSIGYNTGSPSRPLYQINEGRTKTELEIGADISYASSLEQRYNIFARGLDRSNSRMERVATTQVQRTLEL